MFFLDHSRSNNDHGKEHQNIALLVSILLSFNTNQLDTPSPPTFRTQSVFRLNKTCEEMVQRSQPVLYRRLGAWSHCAGGTGAHTECLWRKWPQPSGHMVFQTKAIFFPAVPFCTERLKFHWARDAIGSCEAEYGIPSWEKRAPARNQMHFYFSDLFWTTYTGKMFAPWL